MQQPLKMLKCSTLISASGSCQVWRPWEAVRLSLQIVDSCAPLLFHFVSFTSYPSSSSSQTQQPFMVLPRSTRTSARGSCQVWRTCTKVSLSLPIVDTFVILIGPFHILPFFFLLPNTTAFQDASSFNADISQWVVSSVTSMYRSTSFLANCW